METPAPEVAAKTKGDVAEDQRTGVGFVNAGTTVAILSSDDEPKNDCRPLIFAEAQNNLSLAGHAGSTTNG